MASFRKHTFVFLLPLHGHQTIPRFAKVRSRQEVVTTPWPALLAMKNSGPLLKPNPMPGPRDAVSLGEAQGLCTSSQCGQQSTRLLLSVLLVCLVDLGQVTNPSLLGLSPQALTCNRALCFPISSSLGDDILSVTLQTAAHSSSALGGAAQLDLSAPAPPLQD